MNAYFVRRALGRDMERILEIEALSFGADAYDRKLFAEYLAAETLFLVVERGGKVRGYLIAGMARGAAGMRAEVVSVAVAPADRGTGAAQALMDSMLRRLKRRSIRRVGLMVKVSNERAKAFYAKYGFRRKRRVAGYYEDAADGLWMVREG